MSRSKISGFSMLAEETLEYGSKGYLRKDRDIGNRTQIPCLLVGKTRNWDQDCWVAGNFLFTFCKNHLSCLPSLKLILQTKHLLVYIASIMITKPSIEYTRTFYNTRKNTWLKPENSSEIEKLNKFLIADFFFPFL